MSSDKDSSINFTREAFLHPANLVSLLLGTITAFVFTDVGLISNTLLTLVFGAELVYLGVMPQLQSFRRSVEMKKRREKSEDEGDKTVFHQLDARSQKRFLVLKHITAEVKKNFSTISYTSQGMLENIQKKMDGLLSTYLKLLDMNQKYQVYMNSEVEEELKREVQLQEEKLADIHSEKLKSTRQRRINILNKRLNKFDVAKEKYLICETHLETIEDAIRFIYEQSMTMPNAEDVGLRLDHLLEEMDETTSIIEDLDQSLLPGFDHLDQELELAELRKEAEDLHKKTENNVKEKQKKQ